MCKNPEICKKLKSNQPFLENVEFQEYSYFLPKYLREHLLESTVKVVEVNFSS